jgi:hypothetical protein
METWVFRLNSVHCGSIIWSRAKLGFTLSLYSVLQQIYAVCGGYSNCCVRSSESNLSMNARFDVVIEQSSLVGCDAMSLLVSDMSKNCIAFIFKGNRSSWTACSWRWSQHHPLTCEEPLTQQHSFIPEDPCVRMYRCAPLSAGNMFWDILRLRETVDNTEHYI